MAWRSSEATGKNRQDYESGRFSATLLGQLGLDHSSFNFSRNVLGSDYTYPFAFYSFNNGFAFRDSTGVTVVDNNSGNILLEEPAGTNTRIDKGKAILQKCITTIWEDDKRVCYPFSSFSGVPGTHV